MTVKRTVRENINAPYSLHDMNVVAFEAVGDGLIMRMQSGMVETSAPYGQPDGYVEFHQVQWDFSYVYLLGATGNTGSFTGEKMYLKEFMNRHEAFGFSIMDETYGYNMTKYGGYLISNGKHNECLIEIYHEGDMVFVAEE